MNSIPSVNTPHALYRFFDASGDLLYVGITNDPGRRWTDHRRRKDWWHEVKSVTVDQHSSREAALRAESLAIIEESPKYNVAGAARASTKPISLGAVWDDQRWGTIATANVVPGALALWVRTAPITNQQHFPHRVWRRLCAHKLTGGAPVRIASPDPGARVWWRLVTGVEFQDDASYGPCGRVPGLRVLVDEALIEGLQNDFRYLAGAA